MLEYTRKPLIDFTAEKGDDQNHVFELVEDQLFTELKRHVYKLG